MNKRKAIRIIVIVFIVIITGFFIWKLSIKRADIDSNIFIECIEQDIDSLHNSSFKNIYEVGFQ